MSLPTDAAARKKLQLYTFMFKYFPDAWLAVVDVARAGNDQHNPGEPLHWARGKSTDQMNAAFNHMFDYGMGAAKDTDGCWHLAKSVWRQMAQLQLDIEAERAIPSRPGALVPMTHGWHESYCLKPVNHGLCSKPPGHTGPCLDGPLV